MPFGTTPVQGVEYTNYASTPQLKVPANRWGARPTVWVGTYQAAALAKGSQIAMVRIPKGHLILPTSRLVWSALGAGVVILGVGDQFICDRFMTRANGVNASSSEVNTKLGDCGRFNSVDAITMPLRLDGQNDKQNYKGLYETTCDTDILVVISYAAAATGALKLIVETIPQA